MLHLEVRVDIRKICRELPESCGILEVGDIIVFIATKLEIYLNKRHLLQLVAFNLNLNGGKKIFMCKVTSSAETLASSREFCISFMLIESKSLNTIIII